MRTDRLCVRRAASPPYGLGDLTFWSWRRPHRRKSGILPGFGRWIPCPCPCAFVLPARTLVHLSDCSTRQMTWVAQSLCYPLPRWLLVILASLNVSQRQLNQSGSHRPNLRKILYVIMTWCRSWDFPPAAASLSTMDRPLNAERRS
jgi:hypothetical protein